MGPKPDQNTATTQQTEPLSMRRPTVPSMVSADRQEIRRSISSTNDGGRGRNGLDRCRTGPPNGWSIGEAYRRHSIPLDRYGHVFPGSEQKLNDALDALADESRAAAVSASGDGPHAVTAE